MNLQELEVEDVVDVVIRDRNGDETDAVFQLAGPGHPARVAFERKASARSLREFNRRGKAQLPDDPDELYDAETERLVALTLGWRGVTDGDAKPLAYSAEVARKFYENRRLSVRTQVSRALTAIGNFTSDSQ